MPQPRPIAPPARRPARIEPLEHRTLLAGVVESPALEVHGTDGDDVITIDGNETGATITFNGTTHTLPSLQSILIRAAAGNDTIALTGPARAFDAVHVDAGDGDDTITWRLHVTNLSPTLDAGPGNDAITLDRADLTISAGPGDDTLTVWTNVAPTRFTFAGGDGADAITYNGGATITAESISIGYADENRRSPFTETESVLAIATGFFVEATHGIPNPPVITLQGRYDDRIYVYGSDQADIMTFTEEGLTLNGVRFNLKGVSPSFIYARAGDDVVTIEGLSVVQPGARGNIIVQGNDGNDVFNLGADAGRDNFSINGDDGDDTLNYAAENGPPIWFDGTAGQTTVNVLAGHLSFRAQNSAPRHRNVTVNALGGSINLATIAVGSLHVGPAGKAIFHYPYSTPYEVRLALNSLNIEPGGILDIHDHQLVLRTAADDEQTRAATLARLHDYVRAARNSPLGLWNGWGITSSAARANAATRGLSVLVSPGITTYPAIPAGDLVVAYSLNGDTNLDNKVNADDYFRIDNGFLAQPPDPTYRDGDFNFDDTINADDYFLIDSAFLAQSHTPIATAAPSLAAMTATDTRSLTSARAARRPPSVFTEPRRRRPR